MQLDCLCCRKLKIKKVLVLALSSFCFVGLCCANVESGKQRVKRSNNDIQRLQEVSVDIRTTQMTNSIHVHHRVGQALSINCSLNNHSANEIGWKINGEWEPSRTNIIISGGLEILVLHLERVKWQDNGTILYCGQRNNNLRVSGRNTTLIVGDLPEAPIDAHFNIVSLDYIIHIHWRAPLHTEHSLQTTYKIIFTNCYNTTYCKGIQTLFSQQHIIGKEKYVLKKNRYIELLTTMSWPNIYNVTLSAQNVLGEQQWDGSLLVDVSFSPFLSNLWPTPEPPKSLTATPRNSSGSSNIFVQWVRTERQTFSGPKMNFSVIYTQNSMVVDKDITEILQNEAKRHLGGQKEIKIKNVGNLDSVILKELHPFTTYYIYVTANFIKGSPAEPGGGYSELKGPSIVQTLEGVPDTGPSIIAYSSKLLKTRPGERNVSVFWKVPSKSAWKGVPSSIHIYCRSKSNSSLQTTLVLPVKSGERTPDTTTIPYLSVEQAYDVYTKLCNKHHCGGIGNQPQIKPVAIHVSPSRTPLPDSPASIKKIEIIAGVTVSAMLVILVCVALVYFRRGNAKRRRAQPTLHERVPDVIAETGKYQNPEYKPSNNIYASALMIINPNSEAQETKL